MKHIFHKNSIHPVVFTVSAAQHESSVSQYKKSIEDDTCIVPITSELQYFERRIHLYRGYASCLEPLSDLHVIVVKRLQGAVDDVADEPHLKSIKYEISSASGFPFYWINEQVDSFIKSMKCCSKPETKTLSMINVDENTGIRLKLDFGYDSLCKKITLVQNYRELGVTEVGLWSFIHFLRYRIFHAQTQRQDIFKITQKKNSRFCLTKAKFPTDSDKEFNISFGKHGTSKGKVKYETGSASYTMCLYHGLDPIGKLVLISSVILIDLQKPYSRSESKNCNFTAIILQFLASCLFYIVFFVMLSLFIFMIFRIFLR